MYFVEHLDFMNTINLPQQTFTQLQQVEHDYIGYQSLTDVPKIVDCDEILENCDVSPFIMQQ